MNLRSLPLPSRIHVGKVLRDTDMLKLYSSLCCNSTSLICSLFIFLLWQCCVYIGGRFWHKKRKHGCILSWHFIRNICSCWHWETGKMSQCLIKITHPVQHFIAVWVMTWLRFFLCLSLLSDPWCLFTLYSVQTISSWCVYYLPLYLTLRVGVQPDLPTQRVSIWSAGNKTRQSAIVQIGLLNRLEKNGTQMVWIKTKSFSALHVKS